MNGECKCKREKRGEVMHKTDGVKECAHEKEGEKGKEERET